MNKTLRVLLPEDSEDDAALLLHKLRKLGYATHHLRVEDRAGMERALTDQLWDVILCDYSMPDFSGLEALRLVQTLGLDIPFIVVSGDVGEETAVHAMKAGAHDYLMKDNLSRLGEAIERELGQARIRAERRQNQDRIGQLNRLLQAIRRINRLIVQEKNPETILLQAARVLVETRGYQNAAFIHAQDPHRPMFVAESHIGENGSCAAMSRVALIELPACLKEAASSAVPDVLDREAPGCTDCPLQAAHANKVRIAMRMAHGDRVFGGAVISLPHGVPVDTEELELFAEAVGDIAYAIHGIELAEQERQGQVQFRQLFENMAQGVAYQDERGAILSCNPAAERILGVPFEQLKGCTLADERWSAIREDGSVYPQEEHPSVVAARTGVRAKGTVGVLNPADGRHRWVTIDAVPEQSGDPDRPFRMFTTLEDITPHREAVADLREAQQIAGLGRWQLDFGTGHLAWSPSIYELFEVDSASFEATYEAFLSFVHPDDRAALDQAYRTSVETRSPYSITHRLQLPDGKLKWVRELGRTDYAEDGTPSRSVGTVQDITELKLAEEKIRELEHQYHQAQKLETVGRLAGGIAHDFNNLLTVINSYARFAADELRPGDPMRSDIQQIMDAGDRAASLTRQLLAFSRKQLLEPKVIDLNAIVLSLETMLRRLIGEDIEFQTVLDQGLALVHADPGQIEQVLMNLAVNARDAMPRGGMLTIETRNLVLDEDYVGSHPEATLGPHAMIAVSDNGEGMTDEVKERLFEPFFTTKEVGQGTGLGLSTVWGIVKQSGGSIWVYSEPGRGSTFKVYLPAVAADRTPEASLPEPGPSRGQELVLIVEDEDAVRNLAKRILIAAGYEVLVAANGGEALLECERNGDRIALMLTDVVMPKMSGKELADRLAPATPNMRVLYMSGYTDNAIVHHGFLDAGTEFLAKPFSANELLRKVRAVLDGDGNSRSRK